MKANKSLVTIESSQNSHFKKWRSLLDSKGIQEHQKAILAGKKVITEQLKNHYSMCTALIVPNKIKEDPFKTVNLQRYVLSLKLFNELDTFGTGLPLLVVNVPKFNLIDNKTNFTGCSLFLTQQDPKNIGALLRSAAAFNVDRVILGQGAAHPFHPQSTRAASGSLFAHKYFKGNLESAEGVSVVGLDMEGENLKDFIFPKNFILVPGVEGKGLSRQLKLTHKINIRTSAKVESLNVAQATAIALYEFFQK